MEDNRSGRQDQEHLCGRWTQDLRHQEAHGLREARGEKGLLRGK